MGDGDSILLVVAGVIAGAVLTFIFMRGRQSPAQEVMYVPYPIGAPEINTQAQVPLLPAPAQAPAPVTQPSVQSSPVIENEEVWEIIKDKRGRVTGLKAHRKVHSVGGA